MGETTHERPDEGRESAYDDVSEFIVESEGGAEADTSPQSSARGRLTLVETDHTSEEHVSKIQDAIEREQPDVVAVELDDIRYRQLVGDVDDEDVDASDVMSGKTGYQFLGSWLVSDIEARFSDRFERGPGADIKAAIESAETAGIDIALVDRDLNDTAQRLWARLGFRSKLTHIAALTSELGGGAWKAGLGLGLFWGLLFGSILSLLWGPFVLSGLTPELSTPVVGSLVGPLVSTLDALIAIVAIGLVLGIPLSLLLASGTRSFEETPVEFDQLRDRDPVTAMVEVFGHSVLETETLLDERDAFVAHRLLALQDAGYDVVAVVGAGRRADIERYVETPHTLPPQVTLVGPVETGRFRFVLYRTIGYAFTVGFLFLFVLLALGGAQDTFLLQLFAAWFVVNFVAAAGVAYLAGAHWTSASVGGGVAWLTSVNPMITPGLFIGYVELRYTKVRLSDIPRMKAMLSDRKGSVLARLRHMHRQIGLFRVLFIMTVANLASFFASILFVAVLLPYLAADIGGVSGLGAELANGMWEGSRILSDLLPWL